MWLKQFRQRPILTEVDHPPTAEELEDTLEALKNNKAGGKNRQTLELVKHVGTAFDDYVLDLFKSV